MHRDRLESDYDLMPTAHGEGGGPRGPSPLDWASLILSAAARRKRVVLVVFLVSMCGVAGFYRIRTPLYRVETKLLAQKSSGVPSLGEADPARSANQLVLRRENLLNLIKQTNLPVGKAQSIGEPSFVFRDTSLESSEAEDDALNRLVRALNRSFFVSTEDSTITIGIEWPNAEQAFELAQAAQQNFLEMRHVQEITALGEVISLLDARATVLREQLEATIEEVQQESSRAATAVPRVASPTRPVSDEETVRLKSALEAKERAILDLEGLRRRRLADMHAELTQLRGVYSEEFPAVVSLRKEIAAMSVDTPQLATLRAEEAQLRSQLGAKNSDSRRQVVAPSTPLHPTSALDSAAVDRDERVREVRGRYQQMLERLTTAQVEFDTASAAFKHRYKIIWPASLPKRPVSPNPFKILGAGLLAALGLSLLAAAAPDLVSRRVLKQWQLERGLGLPVLATLPRAVLSSQPDVVQSAPPVPLRGTGTS